MNRLCVVASTFTDAVIRRPAPAPDAAWAKRGKHCLLRRYEEENRVSDKSNFDLCQDI
jgi:hypothetical protein